MMWHTWPCQYTNFVIKAPAAAPVMIMLNDRILVSYEFLADRLQLLWLDKEFA